jgi:hypothetical protein
MVDEVSLNNGLSFSQENLGIMRSSCAYHDGYIYQTSENGQSLGYLFKVRFQDGMFLDEGWSSMIGFSTSTPVIFDGLIYVGTGSTGILEACYASATRTGASSGDTTLRTPGLNPLRPSSYLKENCI